MIHGPNILGSYIMLFLAASDLTFITSQFSHSVQSLMGWPTLCDCMDWTTPGFPVLSPTSGACSNSCPSSQWCHPTISSCLQSFPASGSFLMSWLFTSSGQSTGASASASVLSINVQDWSPLGWIGLTSLLSKGLSRVFSNTIVWKHQFSSAQASLWSNSHICTWLLEKTVSLTVWTFVSKVMSLLFNMCSRFVIAFLPKIF